MRVSYDKLWRIMKNNKMKKSELAAAAEISDYAMTKLNKEEPVSLEIIMRLCKVFHCDIGDLVEIIEDLLSGFLSEGCRQRQSRRSHIRNLYGGYQRRSCQRQKNRHCG